MSKSSPNRQIILFDSADGEISLDVTVDVESEDVWLNRQQMSLLFGRDIKTIGKHIGNALREELSNSADSVVAKFATTATDGKTYQIEYYNLDVIISVGYRVKSQRGVEFRRWATGVLHRYVMDGDGNKRIAACLFLYFLDRNGILFVDGVKTVDDSTLVAMTIMIAESRPDEKEAMVSLVMNFITLG